MRRYIKIFVVILFMFAAVFTAQDWAIGNGDGGGGGHAWGGGHGGGKGHATPEIDPGMASSAIALLSCGLLILTSKPKQKK